MAQEASPRSCRPEDLVADRQIAGPLIKPSGEAYVSVLPFFGRAILQIIAGVDRSFTKIDSELRLRGNTLVISIFHVGSPDGFPNHCHPATISYCN